MHLISQSSLMPASACANALFTGSAASFCCFFKYFCTSLLCTPAPSFARLEGRKLFFIAACTYKSFFFSFDQHLHTFVTLRTARIGRTGNSLSVSTFSVLAYQHLTVFTIYCKKTFSAVRTDFICQVVVTECTCSCLDLTNNFLRIFPDSVKKCFLFQLSL